MHSEYGREVKLKCKIEYIKTFAPHESPAKRMHRRSLKCSDKSNRRARSNENEQF